MKQIVLGLVGYSGAGKGTVAEYLFDKKSFSVVSLSDVARQEAQRARVNLKDRKALHIFSNGLRTRLGNDVFAKRGNPLGGDDFTFVFCLNLDLVLLPGNNLPNFFSQFLCPVHRPFMYDNF